MDTANLLEEVKKEIAKLQKVVDVLEDGGTSKRKGKGKGKGKGTRKPMSQEARDKIAAAQKKRWAKTKKEG